jgi:hypothetical protein
MQHQSSFLRAQAEAAGGRTQLDESTIPICPNCATRYTPGELICPHCAAPFVTLGKTTKIDTPTPVASLLKMEPIGAALSLDEHLIMFEAEGQSVTFSVRNSVSIGRFSEQAHDPQPDVSLNVFDAAGKGVSRQHLKLLRRQEVLYIEDLGSSNGTFLNGRPLMRNCLRVLRHGDELQVGVLKLNVRFLFS